MFDEIEAPDLASAVKQLGEPDLEDYVPFDSTLWIEWHVALAQAPDCRGDCDEDVVCGGCRREEDFVEFQLDPDEPECPDADEHDWERGTVYGAGGGVVWTDTCRHCRCERTTDTWARSPMTGDQGAVSISYLRRK